MESQVMEDILCRWQMTKFFINFKDAPAHEMKSRV